MQEVWESILGLYTQEYDKGPPCLFPRPDPLPLHPLSSHACPVRACLGRRVLYPPCSLSPPARFPPSPLPPTPKVRFEFLPVLGAAHSTLPPPPYACPPTPPCLPVPSASLQVRLEFLHVLGDWMLHLPERMDHEQRLMPYLLSALNDESPQIQVRIRVWI